MYAHPLNPSYPPSWTNAHQQHRHHRTTPTSSPANKLPSPSVTKKKSHPSSNPSGSVNMSFDHSSFFDASFLGSLFDQSRSSSSIPGRKETWLSESTKSYIEMERSRSEALESHDHSDESSIISAISSTSSVHGATPNGDIDDLELYIAQPPTNIFIPSTPPSNEVNVNNSLLNESIMTVSPAETPTKSVTTISPRSRPRHHRVMPMVGNEEVDFRTMATQKGRDRRNRNRGLVSDEFNKILENLNLN